MSGCGSRLSIRSSIWTIFVVRGRQMYHLLNHPLDELQRLCLLCRHEQLLALRPASEGAIQMEMLGLRMADCLQRNYHILVASCHTSQVSARRTPFKLIVTLILRVLQFRQPRLLRGIFSVGGRSMPNNEKHHSIICEASQRQSQTVSSNRIMTIWQTGVFEETIASKLARLQWASSGQPKAHPRHRMQTILALLHQTLGWEYRSFPLFPPSASWTIHLWMVWTKLLLLGLNATHEESSLVLLLT